ncbi:MAG TPA: ATP-binding protein, partial [Micrococcaceae bacterium]
ISEGRVYPPEKVDAALANYFRVGNLTALRELALLWLADRVEEGLAKYRAKHGIDTSWSTRERVVVGLTGGPEGEVLIRRAARILNRVSGGELLAVHVRRSDGVEGESPQDLEAQRQLTTDLGGTYHSVGGDDPAQALLDFARGVSATQIVVGTSRRPPLARFLAGSGVGAKVVRDSGDIDVHMVTHPLGGRGVPRPNRGDLGRTRVTVGFALAVLLPIAVQLLIGAMGSTNFALATLVQFTAAIAVALVGGLWPAVLAAIWGSLLLNYFSAPPVRTLAISDPQNLLTLVLFVAVSAAVAVAVDRSARRSREAILAGAEAATLSELARGVLASEDTVQIFLEQVREHFQVASVALFRRGARREDDDGPAASSAEQVAGGIHRKVPWGPGPDGAEPDGAEPDGAARAQGRNGSPGFAAGAAGRDGWTLHASVGEPPPSSPADADNVEEISENLALALTGRTLPATDRRLLGAFGAHLMAMEQRDQLSLTRKANLRLAEGNKMRTAVLRAVSHDLRTPLAGIKLAVSSLRQDAVTFTPSEEAELLATIENYSDRLDVLVDNLLDMSRLSSDTVTPLLLPVGWLSVLPAALRGVPDGRVRLELPPNMPAVEADPGMLERVIANIVENAVKYAPESEILIVGTVGGSGSSTIEGQPASELRIIDRGRGVPVEDVVAMFRPFQRLDDISFRADGSTGVGLGLAVAKGFAEAMGGQLDAEKTPGGGLTMVIRLPISSGVARRREL